MNLKKKYSRQSLTHNEIDQKTFIVKVVKDGIIENHGSVIIWSLVDGCPIKVEILPMIIGRNIVGQVTCIFLIFQHLGEQEENIVLRPLVDNPPIVVEVPPPHSPFCHLPFARPSHFLN